MNIQEQINALRRSGNVLPWADADEIADTMEAMLKVVEVAKTVYGATALREALEDLKDK